MLESVTVLIKTFDLHSILIKTPSIDPKKPLATLNPHGPIYLREDRALHWLLTRELSISLNSTS